MMYCSRSARVTEMSNPRSGVHLSQITPLDSPSLVHWDSTRKPSCHAELLVLTASVEEKVDTVLLLARSLGMQLRGEKTKYNELKTTIIAGELARAALKLLMVCRGFMDQL